MWEDGNEEDYVLYDEALSQNNCGTKQYAFHIVIQFRDLYFNSNPISVKQFPNFIR
jgi:hypothetical protein